MEKLNEIGTYLFIMLNELKFCPIGCYVRYFWGKARGKF